MLGTSKPVVFVQTNDAEANHVVAYRRDADGNLADAGFYATGGRGSGQPHLASQSSIVADAMGARLFVANAGSDDVSVFAIGEDGVALVERAHVGSTPTSIAIHGDLLYALCTGQPAQITGFRIDADGSLAAIAGSARDLSAPDADPAQISFSPDGSTLVVTERATDAISTFAVDADGIATGPTVIASSGKTPYGFEFTRNGSLVVTEAAGGMIGAASASSYRLDAPSQLAAVSGPVGNTRSEVCWAVVSIDDRFAYVTNFGDGTISSYTIAGDGALALLDPIAARTVDGQKGIRDEALTGDGRFLYALHADVQKVFGWMIGQDGALEPVGSFGAGLPETVAGLAVV